MIFFYNNIKTSYIYIFGCLYTIMWLSMYSHQQNKCYPPPKKKGVYLPISKLHPILAFANLFANNNL